MERAAEITDIEYSVVDGERMMTPVFSKPALTCLSIFDSILFQSFLDGSTMAFDLCTRQSFPLTGTRPMAFFPPLLPYDNESTSSDDGDEDKPSARGPPLPPPTPAAQCALAPCPPQRHVTSSVTGGDISPHSIPVTRRESLPANKFAETDFNAFEPLLLTGETCDWPAHVRWTFPFFASGELGTTTVQVTGRDGKREEMKLRDYVRRFRDEDGEHSREHNADHPCGYLRGWTYEVDNAALMQDFTVPAFARDWFQKLPKKEDPLFRWIFLGPGGSKTPLHIDPCLTHAWLAQIRGRKRFILYKPEHLQHIYDCKGKAADVREPDRENYPNFDHATPYEVVLQPGDLLFVPAGWAHQVECVDDSISLTHNFLPKQNFSAVRACLLANRLGKTVQEREQDTREPPTAEIAAL